MRRPHQREPVLLGASVRALMRQHDPVFVGLQAQSRDQVTAPPPVERHLVDVHRRLVGLEDAVLFPCLERSSRPPVIPAWPSDGNTVAWAQSRVSTQLALAT